MAKVYLVVDDPLDWSELVTATSVIDFATYLAEFPIRGEKNTRIINLCRTDRYLSKGYYCSLLAEARGHKVIPSVNTLIDLGNEELYLLQAGALPASLLKSPLDLSGESRRFRFYFGRSELPDYAVLPASFLTAFSVPYWMWFWSGELVGRLSRYAPVLTPSCILKKLGSFASS